MNRTFTCPTCLDGVPAFVPNPPKDAHTELAAVCENGHRLLLLFGCDDCGAHTRILTEEQTAAYRKAVDELRLRTFDPPPVSLEDEIARIFRGAHTPDA